MRLALLILAAVLAELIQGVFWFSMIFVADNPANLAAAQTMLTLLGIGLLLLPIGFILCWASVRSRGAAAGAVVCAVGTILLAFAAAATLGSGVAWTLGTVAAAAMFGVILGIPGLILLVCIADAQLRGRSERRLAALIALHDGGTISEADFQAQLPPRISRTYKGEPDEVEVVRIADAGAWVGYGYVLSSESYRKERWSRPVRLSMLVLAALLALPTVLVSLVVFAVFIVASKPVGKLTVIYQRRSVPAGT